MELIHRFVVPASVEQTWAAFNDLESIAPCFPGATLGSVDGDSFTGSVKVKLGPISLLYTGTGTFVERDEAGHRAVIEAKGKDKRGNGTAGATVVAQLQPEGDGTAVEVSTDLSVTGKPAQFGRGVIQDVSDKLLGRFVDCIAGKLDVQSAPATAEDVTAPVAAGPPGDTPAQAIPVEPTRSDPTVGQGPVTPAEPIDLDLGRTILPVLLKRYGVPAAVALVAVVIVVRLLRR